MGFFREQRGATFASSALMEPIATAFVNALERFPQAEGVPLLTFRPEQRKDKDKDKDKDEVAQAHRALRTETTSNTTRNVASGQRRPHLPALRTVGFAAHRRLLDVQQLSPAGLIGADTVAHLPRPQMVKGQRVAALPLAAPRLQALLSVVVLSCLRPQGGTNKDLRTHRAPRLGRDPRDPRPLAPGRRTYDLRRLRLHGVLARVPGTHR